MRLIRAKVLVSILCFTSFWIGSSCCSAAPLSGRGDLFEFHSGIWVNLHHFLYLQALLSSQQSAAHSLSLAKADIDELRQLSTQERDTWNNALSYYQRSMVNRDLLFDHELILVKNQLENAEASVDLSSTNIPVELKNALRKVLPIYQKHWWVRHDLENREWIGHVQRLIRDHGAALRADLSRIYDEPWPQYPVRVDAVAYANWAGAYTTLEPTRPTIATTDPANQGTAALEIVFHETSHGMMNKVMDTIRVAEMDLNSHKSGSLYHSGSVWHAVLFYTTGELVAERIPGYIPYADKNGLWVRAWPAPDRSLIETRWKPHMGGSVSLQESLTTLVIDLASRSVTKRP